MSVLQAHRQRVAALNEAMTQLHALHEQAHELWNRITVLNRSDDPQRNPQLDALHDEVYALADRIARLREQTFGSISREAQLTLTSTVESAHPSIVNPEPAPLGGG
jgi:acyl carrier protein phosphodiesterase